MSSAGSRSGERMVHQDYIARIHFSNALPPPPSLPKLLDIPNTGLRSGQYTTPNFASRLVREQPLNVEADAELGMPLNLVGMPGVFDGDERSIQAPAQAPPVHARDRPLLRPLSALGKPKVVEANVSFLRRTEYISSSTASRRPEAVRARAALLPRVRRPARPAGDGADGPADSPRVIKRKIDRGFELAELDLGDAAKRVKHPSKKQVRLVEAVPLLPDLDAFPDSGAYVTIKFLTNPVSGGRDYDRRMLSALFRPIDRTSSEEALYEAALEAHERDPVHYAKPPNLMNYDFYLPQTAAVAERFRRKLDVDDPEHDSDALYTHRSGESGGFFQFDRVRAYETAQETELDHATKYDDEIILAYDAAPAYYYYPVMQRSAIRPQRTKNIARTTGLSQEGDEQIVDQLDITVEEPTEELRKAMKSYKEKPLGLEHEVVEPEAEVEAEPEAEPEPEAWEQTSMTAVAAAETDVDADGDGDDVAAELDADADVDVDAEGEVERLSRRSSAVDRFESKTPDEDRDAEGEADEEDEALQS